MPAIPASFRKISKSMIAHFAWLISMYAWYVYMFMCVLVHVYMTGIQHRATSFVNIYLKVCHWPWDSPIARLASTPGFSMSGASALSIEPSSETPLKYFWLLYVCTCIHIHVMCVKECWCVCTAHAWRSEDDFREWVLSSHCEFQGLNSSLHAYESKASCSLGPFYVSNAGLKLIL